MDLKTVQSLVLITGLVARAFVLLVFFQRNLLRRYPFFAAYLAIDTICDIGLMRYPYHKLSYAEAFGFYQIVASSARLGLVIELYAKVWQKFRGSAKVQAPLMLAILSIVTVITLLGFNPRADWGLPHTLAETIHRLEGQIMAGSLLLLWVFFRHLLQARRTFPANLVRHWKITTVYFAIAAVAELAGLAVRSGPTVTLLNIAMLSGELLCCLAWMRYMTAAGEFTPARPFSSQDVRAIEDWNQDLTSTITQLPAETSARLKGAGRRT